MSPLDADQIAAQRALWRELEATLDREDHDAELAADPEYLALCDKHTEDAFDDACIAEDRGDFFNPGLTQLGGVPQ